MNCILRPRGFTLGFENGFPNDFPDMKSSIPEFSAFSCAKAFVEPDKSKIYVVNSGAGKVGKVSSERIDLSEPLSEPHPVSTSDRVRPTTTIDILPGCFRLNMCISM